MKTKGIHIVWTLTVLCLLLFSSGWGGVWIYASQQSVPRALELRIDAARADKTKTILPEGGTAIDLGGLDIPEAKQKLADRKTALEQLRLTAAGGPSNNLRNSWALADLGFTVNIKPAIAALETLENGSLMARADARWHFPDRLSLSISWDRTVFLKKMRNAWGYLEAGEPVDAKRTIRDDDSIVYTPHKDAFRLDPDTMFSRAAQALGQVLGQDWSGSLKPIAIPIELKVVHPAITLDRLKAEGVTRMISSFTTNFRTSGSGRAYNVEMTARSLNDWELAPGEVFDYSKVVAATNEHYGYRAAPVILNGAFVDGVGGGICQVSSTLYNAVLRAGLELVERRNHSLPVAYLPMGQDATFAEGAINFRFKNTTGKTLIVRTVVNNRQLTVKLFGTMPKNVSYKITSKTLSTIAPTIKEVARASLEPGSRLLLTPGKSGYVVETFRSKLVDGKVVASSRISRDTYKAQPAVYAVAPEQSSPGSKEDDEKPLLEDGVAE
ncbi:VanW family protein [Paenibacillus sacheonensis]|uniref:G5 domain-containing protein n=1 Tax=Paenibacillus sacheonensis TaxID=742054 RepID=A0A7X5C4A9_9BACL|nr:VanW family protein [Paenibacillus sacheonensis]MBM7566442.1 vancomycin resistance protein YoaR [Paenibacillus sacheonensis]NBC73125.1 hypothetical protein [Paenibacillus sacheonensis]